MLKEAPSRPGWGFFVQNRSWKAHETHFNIAFDRPAGAYAGRMLRHRAGEPSAPSDNAHSIREGLTPAYAETFKTYPGIEAPTAAVCPRRRNGSTPAGPEQIPPSTRKPPSVRMYGTIPLAASLRQWNRGCLAGSICDELYSVQSAVDLFTAWRQPPQHWLFAYCPVSSAASLPGF